MSTKIESDNILSLARVSLSQDFANSGPACANSLPFFDSKTEVSKFLWGSSSTFPVQGWSSKFYTPAVKYCLCWQCWKFALWEWTPYKYFSSSKNHSSEVVCTEAMNVSPGPLGQCSVWPIDQI